MSFVSAVQHVAVMAVTLVFPVVVGRAANAPAFEITTMLRLSMLALAAAVLLQALPRGPVGCRLLAPSIFTGTFLAPSILAVQIGGLPLAWGMTIFAGATESILAQFWYQLRMFIPSETMGTVVFLVGVNIGLVAVYLLLGDNPRGSVTSSDAIVAGVTLAVMIALNIWTRGPFRIFCTLIGIACGYVVAVALGLLTAADWRTVTAAPVFAAPSLRLLAWSFNGRLVVPFVVSGLAAAMTSSAVITTYERVQDADWVRPDMRSIGRGIFASGIATAIAGLLGTVGLAVSSANLGLAAATGIVSRSVAYVVSAVLFVLAFQPWLIGVLVIMPRPVMAASLIFTSVFTMIGGVQIISSRVLDARRILVIGMGMMGFFIVSVYPTAFINVAVWERPIVGSPLVFATVIVLGLNLIFRIGIRRTVTLRVDPATVDMIAIGNFIERAAGGWGTRRDVTHRVQFGIQQFIEAVIDTCAPSGQIGLSLSYDELRVDAVIDYTGAALELPDERPTEEEIIASDVGARRLAGFLVRNIADKAELVREGERHTLRLVFEQ